MPRQKKYIEEEVIEKATELFWRNGYEATSVRMLESEMGINQFSIYSSFGNKQGVFLESIRYYKNKLKVILDKLDRSKGGKEDIKQFFYDFVQFSRETGLYRGCLMVNTVSELGEKLDKTVMSEMISFTKRRDEIFRKKLEKNVKDDSITINDQTNWLSVAINGLAVACKVSDRKELNNFIETTFKLI